LKRYDKNGSAKALYIQKGLQAPLYEALEYCTVLLLKIYLQRSIRDGLHEVYRHMIRDREVYCRVGSRLGQELRISTGEG
jgi:hypothetical protein